MTDHSDLIAVRCEGCGSAWTDADLARERAANPRLMSCCPEHKPLTIDQWRARAEAQSLSLSEARADLTASRKLVERREVERDREKERADGNWNAYRDMIRERDVAIDALKGVAFWLEGALQCKDWNWGVDQGAMATEAMERARSALENGPAGLADATNNPASSDLSSLRKGAEVAVKPLEWLSHAWGCEADGGRYRIEDNGTNWPTERYWLYERGERLGKFDTLADAQAAMQTRHETRIRSALVSGSREDGADA